MVQEVQWRLSMRNMLGLCVLGGIWFTLQRQRSMSPESFAMPQEATIAAKRPQTKGSVDTEVLLLPQTSNSEGAQEQALDAFYAKQNKNTLDNTICARLDHIPSFPELVRRLQPVILHRTLHHVITRIYGNRYNNSTLGEHAIVSNGLANLISYWDSKHINNMMVHSMPPDTIRKLIHIIDERLRDPVNNPPLHFMVVGGSIAEGENADHLDLANMTMRGDSSEARFSTQLELLFNEIIFSEAAAPVVKVTNMATGGMTSDIGASIFEYAVFPPDYPRQGPDVVIAAFAYNDVKKFLVHGDEAQSHQNIFQSLQHLVKAAYNNRCDDLPAVIAVDDTFIVDQLTIRENLLHFRVVAELSLWHDVMAVSYVRAFMHHFYSGESLMNLKEEMFGSSALSVHPTLFFHTGVAWLIFLPLLQNLHSFCSNRAAAELDKTTEEEALKAGKGTGLSDTMQVRYIPTLNITTTFQTNPALWRNYRDEIMARCSDPNFRPGNSCSYYWLVHKATEVKRKQDVNAFIKQVSTFNDGWISEGNPIRLPRPGWVAQKQKASFGVKVLAKEFPIRKVTIHYMKSYGVKWADSRLQVRFNLLSNNTGAGASTTASTNSSVNTPPQILEGFHDSHTSVQYHTTFDVDAAVGDKVAASFTLIGGTTFKIIGMFFCSG